MNTVELIKTICNERKIPISRLEKDLGFANGYIRKLKEGKIPSDRLLKIADYLKVSMEYLTTGKEPELGEFSAQADILVRVRNDKDLMQALGRYFELSDKEKKTVVGMINLLSE